MIRFSTHPVADVLKYIYPESPKVLLGGDWVKTSTIRLLTYTKGVACVKCGMVGEFFAVESNGSGPHLNLYGYYKDGSEALLTSDHIVPKSRGGIAALDNRQCLCFHCNQIKDWDIPENGGIQNIYKAARQARERMMCDIKNQIGELKVKLNKISQMSAEQFINKFVPIRKEA